MHLKPRRKPLFRTSAMMARKFLRPTVPTLSRLLATNLTTLSLILASVIPVAFPLDLAAQSRSEITTLSDENKDSVVGGPTGLPAHLVSVPTRSDYYLPYIFVVDKTARSLEIWKSEVSANGQRQFIRSAAYPADLGRRTGDKVSEGDHKTPEGIYFLLSKLEGSTLDFKLYGSRAYTTDYPNHFDSLDGKTGSGIWLHSVPDDVPLTRGSRGCVVVRNDIVKTLDPYIRVGRTPIVISEKVEKRSIVEMEASQAKLEKWLESWRSTWETKSLDDYMKFYDEDFETLKMKKADWRTYKSRLGEKYSQISVKISQPLALEQRGRAVVRFVQSYSSSGISDLGEKTLHLVNRKGEWKIISETWRPDDSAAARAAVSTEPTTKTAAF